MVRRSSVVLISAAGIVSQALARSDAEQRFGLGFEARAARHGAASDPTAITSRSTRRTASWSAGPNDELIGRRRARLRPSERRSSAAGRATYDALARARPITPRSSCDRATTSTPVRWYRVHIWRRCVAPMARSATSCRTSRTSPSAIGRSSELRVSEERYRTLVENSPAFVTRFDRDRSHGLHQPVVRGARTVQRRRRSSARPSETLAQRRRVPSGALPFRQVFDTGQRHDTEWEVEVSEGEVDVVPEPRRARVRRGRLGRVRARHEHRHHGAQAHRGRAGPPGPARPAHGPGQPGAVPRPSAQRARARRAGRSRGARAAVPRPRPVQGRERLAGPQRGRRAAGRGRPPAAGPARAPATPSRASAATSSWCSCPTSRVRDEAGRDRPARADRDPSCPSRSTTTRCSPPPASASPSAMSSGMPRRDDRRGAAPRRRHGDVSRQGSRAATATRSSTRTCARRPPSRFHLETYLRRAVELGELEVYYQPEVDLATGALVGAEALVRWRPPGRRPARGRRRSSTWPRRRGLILDLGAWVLREACRQAGEWTRASTRARPHAAGQPLGAPDRPARPASTLVVEALETGGLEPSSLCLEITETALMADAAAELAVLSGPARARGASWPSTTSAPATRRSATSSGSRSTC